jgi:hypothetical protein
MIKRRTVQITAYVLMFVIGTIAIEGYDVLSGGSITKVFYSPFTWWIG